MSAINIIHTFYWKNDWRYGAAKDQRIRRVSNCQRELRPHPQTIGWARQKIVEGNYDQ